MNWISVDDQLPEEMTDVLLLLVDTVDGQLYQDVAYHNGKAFCVDGGLDDESPTHWMPLPEPPPELPEGYDKLVFIRCLECGSDTHVRKSCDTNEEVCPNCDTKGQWRVLPF